MPWSTMPCMREPLSRQLEVDRSIRYRRHALPPSNSGTNPMGQPLGRVYHLQDYLSRPGHDLGSKLYATGFRAYKYQSQGLAEDRAYYDEGRCPCCGLSLVIGLRK